ncbi:MAG: transglutaminase-like cysteine peptidase [Ghiorsea sp.]
MLSLVTIADNKPFKPSLLIALLLLATITVADQFGLSLETLTNIEQRYGTSAKERLIDWQELIQDNQGQSEWRTINTVNEFFNELDFISDKKHWGRDDYWATPIELLSTKGGDCEDFSIAKYFTLLELGVPDERLRITYVKALRLNQAHMVLTYYETPTSEPLVLDNIVKRIKTASQRPDLMPVYSFNGSNLWMSKERGQGRKVQGGSQRINLWRDLNVRMQQERNLGRSHTAKTMPK